MLFAHRLIAFACAGISAGLIGTSAYCAPGAVPTGAAVQSANGTINVRYEKYKLGNGLEVILVEDHKLPLVAFNLWVHVGSRNEAPGQTGFAHLFEHLLFAGSKHIARGQADKLVDSVGGTDSNGSTNLDRTNYYFTLPSSELELGLWIKSDMLGYMTDQVDTIALANQQDVVRNERRESVENQPYGLTYEVLFENLFPKGHPYHSLIVGSHADIQSIKLEDVKSFARTYYRPNNATLVLAGDFKPAQAKKLVQKYFGALKAGESVPMVQVKQPVLAEEKRVQLNDRVELSALNIAWNTPAWFQPGDAELDIAASILGSGKSSRLYKKLVYERQIAQSVSVHQSSAKLGSVFGVNAVARPNQSLADIEALVDLEIAALAKTPPSTEEVQRALSAIEMNMVSQLEKVGTLADTLNSYSQGTGDPNFVGKDLARYRAVTPESVSTVVATYLRKSARVVVETTPGEKKLPAEVATPPVPTEIVKGEALNDDEAWRASRPGSTKASPLTLPAAKRFTLANGLTVLHVPKKGLPLVSASLIVRAGQSANPSGTPGLASFTAAMLQEGTTTRTSQQLADEIASLGVQLRASAGSEETRIHVSGLKAKFKQGLTLVADMALHPAFDAAEVERLKGSRRGALAQQRSSPASVAGVVSNLALFGDEHPLGHSALGNEASIKATDSAALKQFWQNHYRPDQTALVVAGDIDEKELRPLVQSLFGKWKKPVADLKLSKAIAAKTTTAKVVVVDKPGSPQTALSVVSMGPLANHPESASLKVMNNALGGLFTSRINTQLREVKGYTYGVYSGYSMGRETGQFGIRGSVRTDITGAALVDLFKEIDGMRAEPMGEEELSRVRNAQLLALPGLFDTNLAVADSYANDWSRGMSPDSIVKLPGKYAAVTARSAFDAAKTFVDPKALIVVAVGDKAKLLPQLEALGRMPLEVRDSSGKLVAP
jgi:zinc protease